MGELFAAVVARGAVPDALSDRSWLQAMLDAEAALAGALAEAGVVPPASAAQIERACDAERFDAAAIGRAAAAAGNPVVPLVAALRAAVGGEAAVYVHRGATSQDILDSAAMLVSRRALAAIAGDLRGAADAAAALAAAHRGTVMAGRTLLQHAVPITFGLKAAGWMTALDAARAPLRDLEPAAQLGGAAGSLASLGAAGPAVAAAYARRLGLAEPVLPWHADRTRVGALAGALGVAAGAAAKVATDVILLAQTEVGELRETEAGGSSAMPHKQNPVAAISARACAAAAPGLVATLLAAMAHEHERAAGPWHAEWKPLADLLVATGSAAAWLLASLERLEVDPARMRANLDASGGRLLAERVAIEVGDPAAVQEAAMDMSRPFAEALAAHPALRDRLTRERAEELLGPEAYAGAAGALVDRALEARRSA